MKVDEQWEGPNSDGWYHRRQVPHCCEFILSYFASVQDVSPDSQILDSHAPQSSKIWRQSQRYHTIPFAPRYGLIMDMVGFQLPVVSYFPCVRKCVRRHRYCSTIVAKQTSVCKRSSPSILLYVNDRRQADFVCTG